MVVKLWRCQDCGKEFDTFMGALDCEVGIDPMNLSDGDLESDKWYTQQEIAAELGKSLEAVRRWFYGRASKIFPHQLDLAYREDSDWAKEHGVLEGVHGNVRWIVPERDVQAAKAAYASLGPSAKDWEYKGPIYHYDGGGFLFYTEEVENV